MSLPCDVNHPLWTHGSRWGDSLLRKFRQPEKREARAVTCQRNGAADCAQVQFQPHFVIVRKERYAEQIDAHHTATAVCFIGLVYISTFWKQFIKMDDVDQAARKIVTALVFDFR